MANLPGAENRSGHVMARDLKWSHTEKGIAGKAFERALERKFEAVIRTAKEMAGKIEQPADLWGLEFYLAILWAHSSLRVREERKLFATKNTASVLFVSTPPSLPPRATSRGLEVSGRKPWFWALMFLAFPVYL